MSVDDNNANSLLGLLGNVKLKNISIIWKDPKNSEDIEASYEEVLNFSEKIFIMTKEYDAIPQFIGILMDSNICLPSLIIGILKHKSAFVSLDPQRTTWNRIIADKLGIKLIFSSEKYPGGQVINSVEFFNSKIYFSKISHSHQAGLRKDDSIAYACQTSGTTGLPKVIQVSHASIVPNITFLKSKFELTPCDVVFQAAPPTFDPSIVETFLALSSGATLLMVPTIVKQTPSLLATVLSSGQGPTVIQATPTLISSLGLKFIQNNLLGKNSKLRILAFGGELCPNVSVLKKWKHGENCTRIFNLYGVTEVSCWSTCKEIISLLPEAGQVAVPLGEPFPSTQLQIKDEEGNIADEGELFITNGDGMCLVEEGQVQDSEGITWCATGDLVRQSAAGAIHVLGRKSDVRLVKRFGQKVSLDLIETSAMNSDVIQACHAMCNASKSQRLVLFIVLSEGFHYKNAIKNVKHNLRKCLPSPSLPDAVINVPALPITSHGKVDKRKLKLIAEEWEVKERNENKIRNIKDVEVAVKDIWNNTLLVPDVSSDVEDEAQFLASGGDSALATLMAGELSLLTGIAEHNALLTTILNGTFKDICLKLLGLMNPSKMPMVTDEPGVSKRARLEIPVIVETGASHVWKLAVEQPGLPKLVGVSMKGSALNATNNTRHSNVVLSIDVSWKYDMEKCIDASPIILEYDSGELVTVIGSHSGLVVCVDVKSGVEKWCLRFCDRVESSAAVSSCGQFVSLGCYDGRVYCIEVFSGTCCWAFQTEAMVKSSPVFHSSNVIFGSYDQCLYCVCLENGKLIWKTELQVGPLLATPCVCNSDGLLVATLGGTLASVNLNDGSIRWTCTNEKPYFASPVLLNGEFAVCGDVGGLVTCIDTQNGNKKWSYEAKGNIFSSFSTIQHNEQPNVSIVFGCSQRFLYALNELGQEIWTYETEGRITSTPYSFKLAKKSVNVLAFVTITKQLIFLNSDCGICIYKYNIPWETFSSPVICTNYLIIGNRDNHLYCYDVGNKV